MSSFCHFSHFLRAYNQHGMTENAKNNNSNKHSACAALKTVARVMKERHNFTSFQLHVPHSRLSLSLSFWTTVCRSHVCKCIAQEHRHKKLPVSALTSHYPGNFQTFWSPLIIWCTFNISIVNAQKEKINEKNSPFSHLNGIAPVTIQFDSSQAQVLITKMKWLAHVEFNLILLLFLLSF